VNKRIDEQTLGQDEAGTLDAVLGADTTASAPVAQAAAAKPAATQAPVALAERPTVKPFALLDMEEPAQAPAGQPASAAAAAPAPKAEVQRQATPVQGVVEQAAPFSYAPPELGGVKPLGELGRAELETTTNKDLATDVQPKAAGVSKVKLAVTGAFAVLALVIGWTMFAPSSTPTPSPIARPGAPVQLPTGQAPVTPTGTPPAGTGPTVGIDIGNTQSIALETGDIDMIEQWSPVTPAQQSCEAQVLSPYLQAACKKAGQQRYFQCAPDGFHWDPRLPGCEQLTEGDTNHAVQT
jgi:hypothetical protein